MGLDVSSVGNHEFDEGTAELLRMQKGGCHPVDGCYFKDAPYAGADFPWLAANVEKKDGSGTLLPGTWVKSIGGTKVGFIGMTLEGTPTLVDPAGVANVEFKDEVQTANAQAAVLKKQGVKSIVVLLHEGGVNAGTYQQCVGISNPILTIAQTMTPEIDADHHRPHPQPLRVPHPGPRGQLAPRDQRGFLRPGGHRDRRSSSTRAAVRSTVAGRPRPTTWWAAPSPKDADADGDHRQVERPVRRARPAGRRVEHPGHPGRQQRQPRHRDADGRPGGRRHPLGYQGPRERRCPDRLHEHRWGAGQPDGRAEVRRRAGQITYDEAFDVAPFGNILRRPGPHRRPDQGRARAAVPAGAGRVAGMRSPWASPTGFAYTWDATQPAGSPGRAGVDAAQRHPDRPADTYRVGTLNFLADGGDLFTAFKDGTNLLGGNEDLEKPRGLLRAPTRGSPHRPSRVAGL